MLLKKIIIPVLILVFCLEVNLVSDREGSIKAKIDQSKGKERIDAIVDLVNFYAISKPIAGIEWTEK